MLERRAVTGVCSAYRRRRRPPRPARPRCPDPDVQGGNRHAARAPPVRRRAASAAYRNALDVIAPSSPTSPTPSAAELADQRASLKLIASENYASPAVLLTMGTWLSDKYAEGTIGHRFYAGCQNIDTVEQLAADHARALFGAPHAYVQPHSGIDANLVAFWAILAQRDRVAALQNGPAPSTSTT